MWNKLTHCASAQPIYYDLKNSVKTAGVLVSKPTTSICRRSLGSAMLIPLFSWLADIAVPLAVMMTGLLAVVSGEGAK